MHPILFKIGIFTVYSYGLMIALSFIVTLYLILLRAKKEGIDPSKILDLNFVILISGLIGARLFYVVLNIDYFIENPLEIIMFHHGGLVFYGGFMLVFLSSFVFVKLNKMPFWKIGDLFAPYIALGQAIGRIGCFLNGCCYGKPTEIFGIHIHGIEGNIWPTQLISSFGLFVIFFILLYLRKKERFEGFLLISYFMFYSVGRFLVEFLRGDNPQVLFGLTNAQVISVIMFFVSAVFFLRKKANWKN